MIDHFETCNVQTTGRCTCPGDTERIRAAIRLLCPDEMTPTARNMLMRILEDETEEQCPARDEGRQCLLRPGHELEVLELDGHIYPSRDK